MAKIKRGSLVIPAGSTAERVKRRKLKDAIAKRREAKAAGQEAGVFIAKARKAQVVKEKLTRRAKWLHGEGKRLDKVALGRKVSLANARILRATDKTTPEEILKYARDTKTYTKQQLAELPGLMQASREMKVASKKVARKSGGTATGIKRTAEAAISRIATGKALKGMARAGGVLGIAALFNAALKGNDSKKKRG